MHAMLIFCTLFAIGAFLAEPILFLKILFCIAMFAVIRMVWLTDAGAAQPFPWPKLAKPSPAAICGSNAASM